MHPILFYIFLKIKNYENRKQSKYLQLKNNKPNRSNGSKKSILIIQAQFLIKWYYFSTAIYTSLIILYFSMFPIIFYVLVQKQLFRIFPYFPVAETLKKITNTLIIVICKNCQLVLSIKYKFSHTNNFIS